MPEDRTHDEHRSLPFCGVCTALDDLVKNAGRRVPFRYVVTAGRKLNAVNPVERCRIVDWFRDKEVCVVDAVVLPSDFILKAAMYGRGLSARIPRRTR